MDYPKAFDFISILGPTASGKTSLAVALASQLGTEIVSADSRQIYRRMDLGTGKDLADYVVDGQTVPYHLIDIEEPGTKYNLYRYQHDFFEVLGEMRQRGLRPVVCGGTGLYLESVVRGYNISHVPQNAALRAQLAHHSLEQLTTLLAELKSRSGQTLHNTTDVDTAKRAIRAIEIETYNLEHAAGQRECPQLHTFNIGLSLDRGVRRARITQRLHERLEAGMLDEVRALLAEGIPAEDLIYYGLEYKYLTLHCIGELSYDEMVQQLETAIHQFAKRQMTWFRGMERRGCTIHWLDALLPTEEKLAIIAQWLEEAAQNSPDAPALS